MAPTLQFLDARERFLPFTKTEIRQRMLADPRLSAVEREQLATLFEMIADRFHFEARTALERIKELYAPVDPDGDPLGRGDSPDGRVESVSELSAAYARLLLEANYVEMPREQILACVECQSQAGLAVTASLSDYAEIRVFYRGVRQTERTFRGWLVPWRRKRETVHVLSRVAMLVRLRREPARPVFLKVFKNVVAEDLEMLLPFVKVRMRWLDQLKIGSSVAGGLATAAWKAFTAAMLSPWVFMLVLYGLITTAARGVLKFFSSKAKYLQTLTASLYFQNLANNASALACLVDAAEAEECKELLLAYYTLYVERDRDLTQEALDRHIEQWLAAMFGIDVDFEVDDAVRKLAAKGLLVRRVGRGAGAAAGPEALKVYDLPSALRRLDEVWDNYYGDSGRRTAGEDRIADAAWPPPASQGPREMAA